MDDSNHCVVMTGFGCFGSYECNPSWLAVEQLEIPGVELIKKQIDVIYEEVDKVVPALWIKHKPMLMVHCGVSSIAKQLTIEKQANGTGYNKYDIKNMCPVAEKSFLNKDKENECLSSGLDLQNLVNNLNKLYENGKLGMGAEISQNAGRFVCEYTYFTSLKQNSNRCVFIHVPRIDLEKTFTIDQISESIKVCVLYLIEQLSIQK